MRLILTALIFLFGLFNLFLGFGFLVQPAQAGADFFLTPVGSGGLAVLRADFAAFFGVAAVCMMLGAWRRNGDLLLVPAALFAVAFIGRSISAMLDGAATAFWLPMSVEAAQVILLAAAWRLLPHHKIEEIAG